MTWLLIKLAIRLVVFGLVFGFVAFRSKKISIQPRWALPAVALVFALLNTGIYWVAKPMLNLATLGMLWVLTPLVINTIFLWLTQRLLKYVRVEMKTDGMFTTLWLASLLTLAQGVLYVILDMIA